MLTRYGYSFRNREDLVVGDVVRLAKGDRSPVDGVALATLDSEELFFIQTDQVDGETDWKPRTALKGSQAIASKSPSGLFAKRLVLVAPPPSADLHSFNGLCVSGEDDLEEKATMKHFLFQGVKVESSEVLVLATYVGCETRIFRNSVQRTIDKTATSTC